MEEISMYPSTIPSSLDRDSFDFNATDSMSVPFNLSSTYSPDFAHMIGEETSLVHAHISSANSPPRPVESPLFNPPMPVISDPTEPDAAPHAAHSSSSGYVDDNYMTSNHGVSMHNHNAIVAIDPPQIPLIQIDHVTPPHIVAMPSLHMMINNNPSIANDPLSLCLPPLHMSHSPSPYPYSIAHSHHQILEHDTNTKTNAADPFANSHSFLFPDFHHSAARPPSPPMMPIIQIKRESPFNMDPTRASINATAPLYHPPPFMPIAYQPPHSSMFFDDYAEPYNADAVSYNVKKSSFYVAELDDSNAQNVTHDAPWDDDLFDPLPIPLPPILLREPIDACASVDHTQPNHDTQSTAVHVSEEEDEAEDELSEEDTKKVKKERKRTRKSLKRACKTTAKSTRSKPKEHIKTSRKRSRKEMSDDDEDCNGNCTKKRKIDKTLIDGFVTETMTRKEANKVFNEMMMNESVVMNAEGNWCYVCGCNKSFKSKCHLKRHVEEAHIGRAFRCTYPGCVYDAKGGVFKQRTQTKEHVKNIHFAVSSAWKCFLCDRSFTRWWGVRRHLELRRCKEMKKVMSDAEIKQVLDEMQAGKTRGKCKI
eukprot:316625_1